MIPMEPGPEDYARHIAEQRKRMQEAQAIAYLAHSRTGLMMKFLRRLADQTNVDTARAQLRNLADQFDELAASIRRATLAA